MDTTHAPTPALRADALTKRYGGRTVLDAVSFSVMSGVVTGLVGPNGAGKSTTMRLALGLERADAGTARVCGRPYAELDAPLRRVGAMLDVRTFHPGRSGRAHLRWVAQTHGLPARRVDEVLAVVGLGDAADRRAGGYSLGMVQRLGMATALLGDPDVVILDEPVNGLDPEGVRWMRRLLRRLAAEGRAVLVSSHLMNEMAVTVDHLLVLGRGRLLADCSLAEFVEVHTDARRYADTPAAARPSLLEDAFLRLTAGSVEYLSRGTT